MAPDFFPDLEILADGKAFDNNKWPELLESILSRIEDIALKEFPPLKIPLPDVPPPSTKRQAGSPTQSEINEHSEKRLKKEETSENIKLEQTGEASVDGPTNQDRPNPGDADTEPDLPSSVRNTEPPAGTLPPQLLTLVNTIKSTLQTNFPKCPPHTAQRLAELILQPRRHYRSLPSYLRALDRIVTVASPASAFPLPLSNTGTNNPHALFNGTTSPARDQNDKDFIGGAELTPIPWLRDSNPASPTLHPNAAGDLHTESTSLIDGPNGAGSVETVTVSVNGVSSRVPASQAAEERLPTSITQGELIRQEQEAGITPVPSARVTRGATVHAPGGATTTTGEPADKSEEEEMVHARGPSVIGMEDMGPQAPGSGLDKGIELEGPLGMKAEGADDDSKKKVATAGSSESAMTDVGGNASEKEASEASGVKGADAVDTTTR